jgi:hypothetical protein
MVGLFTHLVFEGKSAILVLDSAVATILVYVLEELKNLRDLNVLRHPLQEILNTDHMECGETLLIFVFLGVACIFKHVDAHLIYFADSVEPQSLLLRLCASLLIAYFDYVSDQRIKLLDVDVI